MTTYEQNQYTTTSPNKLQKTPNNNAAMTDTQRPVGTTEPTATTRSQHTSGPTTMAGTTASDSSKTTSGPHKSDLMNKLDPRVDSKAHLAEHQHQDTAGAGTSAPRTTTTDTPEMGQSGRTSENPHAMGYSHGGTTGGYSSEAGRTTADSRSGTGAPPPGTTTTTGTPHGMGNDGSGYERSGGVPPTSTRGGPPYNPHQSAMEREAQPQGTFDHRPHQGGSQPLGGGNTAHHGTGAGMEPTTYGTNTQQSSTAGPHNSNLANKLDPRVDSDLSGGHPGTSQNERYYGGAGDGASTGQAPMPSMINQGDPNVQNSGSEGLGHHQAQAPLGNGGGMPGTYGSNTQGGLAHQQTQAPVGTGAGPGTYGADTGGAYPDTHHTVTGGTHGGTGAGMVPEQQHNTSTYPAGTNPDPYGTQAGTQQQTSGGQGGLTHGIKAAAAGFHGAGETLRGTLTGSVDRRFGKSSEAAKNEGVASEGMKEIETGKFSNITKEREGALPKQQ